jgi:hypothetical protein
MIREMTAVAAECIKTPGKQSVWSPQLGRYVCPNELAWPEAVAAQSVSAQTAHPPISPQFKLVFLTAATGTFVFVLICLVLSLVAGREPPPLLEKIIMGFFDLAKIGFGAVVGLLGGRQIQGTRLPAEA